VNETKINSQYLIVLKKGESVLSSLKDFCQKQGVANGFFVGLGAVEEAELAHYSVAQKKYTSFKLKEPLEVISLTGNVFLGPEGELIIHAHASLGRSTGEVIGGHLVEMVISGTGEILLTPLFSEFRKEYDPETGLKILKHF